MTSSRKPGRKHPLKPKPGRVLIETTDPMGITFRCAERDYEHARRETGRGTTVDRIRLCVEEPDAIYEGKLPSSVVHERQLPPAPDLSSTQRYFLVISRNEARKGVEWGMDTAYAAAASYGTKPLPDGTHPKIKWTKGRSQT